MSKSNELDILAKLFNKLSNEEREELLDLVNKSNKPKSEYHNKFFDMDISEAGDYKEVNKKLNKNNTRSPRRRPIKMVKVRCKNCGKSFEIAENHPSVNNFICCI